MVIAITSLSALGFLPRGRGSPPQRARRAEAGLTTALRKFDQRLQGIELGADEFLAKPFKRQELLTRVRSLLRVKGLHDQIAAYNRLLEEKVAERTAVLKQALGDLREMDRLKSEFLADISHMQWESGRAMLRLEALELPASFTPPRKSWTPRLARKVCTSPQRSSRTCGGSRQTLSPSAVPSGICWIMP